MTKKNITPPLVLMAAGRSKRMDEVTQKKPKALLELLNKPLLEHFLDRVVEAKIKSALLITGYKADQIRKFVKSVFKSKLNVDFINNPQYDKTNNLYSLYLARKHLDGKSFLLCNADIIVNKEIILGMTQSNGRSVIAIDDVHRLDEIDSPGTIIDSGRIYDLGRHIPRSKNGGYAIGVYKFNEELSRAFFKEAETLLSNNIQAGFHDPLPSLFKNYPVYAHSTQGLSWADVDEPAEIPQMERTIKRIIKEEQN